MVSAVLMQPVVRKQHNSGFKHKVSAILMLESRYTDLTRQVTGSTQSTQLSRCRYLQANVRNYYMQFEETQTQSAIDDKIMSFVQHARPAMPLVRPARLAKQTLNAACWNRTLLLRVSHH
jgi:hypothetical protein